MRERRLGSLWGDWGVGLRVSEAHRQGVEETDGGERDVDMRKAGVERRGARRELQAARSGVRDTETNA